jgi:hypothetical protein
MLYVGIHIANQGDQSKDELLQQAKELATSISPQWMVWESHSDGCRLLVNLEVTEAYWKVQVQKKYGSSSGDMRHSSIEGSFEQQFRRLLEEFLAAKFPAEQNKTHLVLASHPWQCILMLEHMQQKSLHGVYLLSDSFAQGVLQKVSWASWWKCIHMLSTHWENALSSSQHSMDGKRFDRTAWQRSVERLSRACRVLERSTPYQAYALGGSSLARRYGKRLAQVMRWSFAPNAQAETSLPMFQEASLTGFPWESYVEPMQVLVERNLEHPAQSWDQCTHALEEDLSRLGTHPEMDASLFVLSLEWRLTFSDMSYLNLPIPFRYPTQLCFASRQKAALTQAYYTFENMQLHLQERTPATEELFIEPKSVVRWEVRVSRHMRSLPAMTEFLKPDVSVGAGSCQEELERLEILESQLPVPLEGYDLQADWYCRDSYVVQGGKPLDAEWQRPLTASASVRPLYVFDHPQTLKREKNTGALWNFKERVMQKWWEKPAATAGEVQVQNFYQFVSTDGNQLWVARGHEKQEAPWMVYGIYA